MPIISQFYGILIYIYKEIKTCSLHPDELRAAWTAWNESGEIIKIEGLR